MTAQTFRMRPKLCIVVPAYNEGENIDRCESALIDILDELGRSELIAVDSYILFVDDGSTDDTWQRIVAANQGDLRIKGLKLGNNCGHQVALKSGLDRASISCDFAISIDADLQQDPSVIPQFIKAFQDGADVVYGVRKTRNTDSTFKRLSANAFYGSVKRLGLRLVPGHADYRGLSKKALKLLSLYNEKSPFLRGIIPSFRLPSKIIEFEVFERTYGASKYSISKMLELAIAGITSFSIVPLRIVGFLGAFVVASSMLMVLYVMYIGLGTNEAIPGWTSTLIPIYFFGGVQMIGLSIIGEYLGRVFIEVKGRPLYIVEEETE